MMDGEAATATKLHPTHVAVDAAGNLYISDSELRRRHQVWRVDRAQRISAVAGTGEGGDSGDGGPATQATLFPNGLAVDAAGNLYIATGARIRRVDAAGVITTVAGNGTHGCSGDGGPAARAQLDSPMGVAVDSAGTAYIADWQNHRIRRVDRAGVITTVAGNGTHGCSGDGGPATRAQLDSPMGVAVDSAGTVYIADWKNHRIRRVDRAGVITTVAGNGTQGYSGDGGPATKAELNFSTGVAVDREANLYIADAGNHRVRRLDGRGIITTVAGTGQGGFSGDGGPATRARLHVSDVAVDGDGNLYIADTDNGRVRRVDRAGIITTVAGVGVGEFSGDGGAPTTATLNFPRGVAVDGAGNLYIADTDNHAARRLDAAGVLTTVTGTGVGELSGDGDPAAEATLHYPEGVAVDAAGNLYIADTDNQRIRRVDRTGTITTVAGTGQAGYSGDGGPATSARLDAPSGVAVDAAGGLYVADRSNHRIRHVDPAGVITTVAGTGDAGRCGDGGPAATAELQYPTGVAVDSAGNLYIADTGNHRIRRVDRNGSLTTVAGTDDAGRSGDGGPAVAAELEHPTGVAVDVAGNLYIADTGNHRIRRVDRNGSLTTVAGTGNEGRCGDGGPATTAALDHPWAVAVDPAGNLYIADTHNHRIRRVDPAGTITTVAGCTGWGGSGDGGPATEATVFPHGLAVDPAGNLFIAEADDNRVRRMDRSGIITTVAGWGAGKYRAIYRSVDGIDGHSLSLRSYARREGGCSGDGGPATEAQLNWPSHVAIDAAGNLYIADTNNHRIRRVDPAGTITTVAGTGDEGFSGDGGPATTAALDHPVALAVDPAGNLYIADTYNHRIRRVDPAGTITTVADTGDEYPEGVAVDAAGNLYIAWSHIRRVGRDGRITTVVETLEATEALAADPAGTLYVSYFYEADWCEVDRVDRDGTITRVAGTGRRGFSGDGGPATAARIDYVTGLAVDAAGNLYIATYGRLRRVDRDGVITTVAGPG